MNYYNLFYWITRGDSIKQALDTTSNWCLSFFVCSIIFLVLARMFYTGEILENKDKSPEELSKTATPLKNLFKFSVWCFVVMGLVTTVMWVAWAMVPTKKDSLLILGAGATLNFLTQDSAAKQVPSEVMNFMVTELKSLSAEAKVDLGIAVQKDKILQEAKTWSTETLLEKIKVDTSLRKILLE